MVNCRGWWFFRNLLCKVSCSATLDLLHVPGQIEADFTRHSAGIQTSVKNDNHNNNTIIKKDKMKHNFRNTLSDCIPPKHWRAFSIYCTHNCYFRATDLVLSSCGRNIHYELANESNLYSQIAILLSLYDVNVNERPLQNTPWRPREEAKV
jgi:hypothetical protein